MDTTDDSPDSKASALVYFHGHQMKTGDKFCSECCGPRLSGQTENWS